MARRWLLLLLTALALAVPARADDISAAGRSVVRVVVIAFNEDGEVSDFGHGSGFAVAPNRVVTNAHVVQMEHQGNNLGVGVVPSEGAQATRARVIAIDQARDLALLEIEQGSLTPIPVYTGALDDGTPVTAMGYPGNVDLATAQSANDYITPLPPTRSAGTFSNGRSLNGISMLIHTAPIARGNSGGPLLDQCGRVLGVNTLITHTENGDSTFAFAVAGRELTAFLTQAHQPFQAIATECVSMADRLRQDRQHDEDEARAHDTAAAAQAAQARDSREHSLAEIQESRENRMALAVLCLACALVTTGGAGIMLQKDRLKQAKILGGVGAGFLVVAIGAFLSRPSLAAAEAAPGQPGNSAEAAPPSRFLGRNVCRFQPERSRVTVSSTNDVPVEWTDTGCMNQHTQYARNGDVWARVLVPNGEQAVSVLQFRPGNGEYVVTRYLLDAAAMSRVRALRHNMDVKACTGDADARTVLADQQRDISAALPSLPNERLVYSCQNEPSSAR